MKNAIRLICFATAAFMLSNNSLANSYSVGRVGGSGGFGPGGQGPALGKKAMLENKARKTARDLLQKIREYGDMYSPKELRQAIKAMNQAKLILGLQPTPIGGGHGGGGGHQYKPVCSVEYVQGSYYNYYYVHKDGKKFSSGFSSFQDALDQMLQFVQSGACAQQAYHKLDECKVEYVKGSYYNYYYVYKNGKKYSAGYSNVSDAADFLEKVDSAGACKKPEKHQIKHCEIDLVNGSYYNYYYVMQDGEKLSSGYSSFSDADQFMAQLEDAYMCSGMY